MRNIIIILGKGSEGLDAITSLFNEEDNHILGIVVGQNTRKYDLIQEKYPYIPLSIGTSTPITGQRDIYFKERYLDVKAWDFLKEIITSNEDIEIFVSGASTNLGITLMRYPEIKENIKAIYLLGGSSIEGDVTAFAEKNVYEDPFATKVIFDSGIDVYMFGLQVTQQMDIKEREVCMAKVINQELKIETINRSVGIEISSNQTYGMTVCDIFNKGPKENDIHIVKKIMEAK